MTIPFLDLKSAHAELHEELRRAFERVLYSGEYILSDELDSFEKEFAEFCLVPYIVGVGNGLDALTILLRASGVGPGDEVIVPAHTFIATWLSVVHCGAKIVPVDVKQDTMLIDVDAIEAALTSDTAAIVPVHLYGLPNSVEPFERLIHKYDVKVFGDAAQAHGARTGGRPVGSLFHGEAFSFYPSKNLGAIGDGGAVATTDPAIANFARRFRNYGSQSKYDFVEIGGNTRLDPLQAAFLRVKLRVLKSWNERRAQQAGRYRNELTDVPNLILPSDALPGDTHSWYAFCIRHTRRDELQTFLAERGISTQIHYPTPPHLTQAFEDLGLKKGDFPVSEDIATTALSLPIGPHLSETSVTKVIDAIKSF